MMQSSFEEIQKQKVEKINQILEKYIPEEAGYQKTVITAMNYSLLIGGKRLRPMLMQETFFMLGGKGDIVEPFMAAIEMIHTYSLVHDDLPAMDNDEYRRGKQTTWKVFGEDIGILAGDGLLNLAYETALKAFDYITDETGSQTKQVINALNLLAKKAGIWGMIGGQTADVEAETQTEALSKNQLLYIHENKTAALIQAAMMIGATLAGASSKEVQELEKCAYNLGIAFQIQDDILDVIGDSKELGKKTGSDALNHKQTYVTINGLEESKKDVESLTMEAQMIIAKMQGEHDFLEQLLSNLIHRRK